MEVPGLKITNVSTTALSLPIPTSKSTSRKGSKREWGRLSRITPHRPSPVLEYVIVRIDTDEGVGGIGEAVSDIGFFGETLEEVKIAIERYLGPRLIGLDPFDREQILYQLDFRGNSCARSGIDLAVHDLIGKVLDVPVSHILGGRCRDRIEVALEIGGDAEELAAMCEKYMELGVRAFKPKIGGYPDEDAHRLKAVRETVGKDIKIRADANQGYTTKEAIRLCRLAEKYDVGLELLEQPVGYLDLHGMAEVRGAVDVLIEADESCYSIQDAMNIIKLGAADVINIKIEKVGGLYQAKKLAAVAEAAGLQCVIGTAFGLGNTIAAKLHLAASTMIVKDAVEFTEIRLHENLLADHQSGEFGLPLVDGSIGVPTGPGLGVTLDEKKVGRYATNIVN